MRLEIDPGQHFSQHSATTDLDDPLGDDAAPGWRRYLGGGLLAAAIGLFAFVVAAAYWPGEGESGNLADIPLIQADAQPVKEKPADPGGMEVPFTDSLVYNQLAEAKPEAQIERLLPLPEEPLPRASTEAAPAAIANQAQEHALGDHSTSAEASASTETPAVPSSVADPNSNPASVQAPAVEAESKILLDSQAEAAKAAAAETPVNSTPAAETPIAEAPPTMDKVAPSAPANNPITAMAKLPATTRIQLAAVKSETAANAEWQRLQSRFPNQLGGLKLHIQKADLAERGIFYRIQSSPLAPQDAARICNDLKANNMACMVIKR